ncbi:MAG: hypothetical protein Q4B69_08415 [Slackia sp.]|nr:hypothetical protein [Slackia sp.]
MSVGSMQSSRQCGLHVFMGVSTKIDGFRVAKENSHATEDQSVISTSAS